MKCSDQWRSDGRAPPVTLEEASNDEMVVKWPSPQEKGDREAVEEVLYGGGSYQKTWFDSAHLCRCPCVRHVRGGRWHPALMRLPFFDQRAVPLFMSGSLLKTPWGMRDITHPPRRFVFQGAVSSPSPVAASCCAMNCITSRWSLVDWRLFFVRMVPVSRRSSSKGSATRPGSSARARS